MKKRSLRAGLALVLPMSLTAPTASAHVLVGTVLTPNWSGYALAGSAFRGVTGTFNIPVEITSGSCLDETAVWVGLDGLDNHDLLQAGIVESGFALPTSSGRGRRRRPGSGAYAGPRSMPSGKTSPSAPVRVDLPVRMGDLVSVSIFQMSSGWWAMAMHDITAGRSFLLSQPYAGPRPQWNGWSRPLRSWAFFTDPVPFSTVRFHDLGAEGDLRQLERVRCGSKGLAAGPSLVASAAQLTHAGFAVHWAR